MKTPFTPVSIEVYNAGMPIVQLLLILFTVLLIPTDLFAWGPGMHLEIALAMFDKIALLAPSLAVLIQANRNHFIYGAVAPDIQVGKRYVDYMHHCHSWRMGRLILDKAQTDAERAAAYGYLTHLAADTVAHSYYVPYKIVESFDRRIPNHHIYWEMRFDLTVSADVWGEIDHLVQDHYEDVDQLLERVLKKTLFSFNAHKRIFRQILIMQKMKNLRRTLKLYDRLSTLKVSRSEVDHFRRLTYDATTDFLKHPAHATCLIVDPSGQIRVDEALQLRRRMRRMKRSGILEKSQINELTSLVKTALESGLKEKSIWFPDVTDVL